MEISFVARAASGVGLSGRMRRVLPRLLVATALCAAIWLPGCARSSDAPEKPKAKPLDVTVAAPVRMPIVEWDEYVGRLDAVESVEVRSRVSGYLASTEFDEGQMVKAGDILAVIDQRPFQAEIDRNQANLEAAKAQLGQAEASEAQAAAEQKRTEIRLDLAKKRLTRTNQLRASNATTDDELDIREAEFSQAEAEQAVSRANLDSAKSAVVAAQAAVGIAEANLALAKLNYQYTEIRAPISGRISHRVVTEGNLVSGGTADSTLLTTIVSLDPIHVYFDADEAAFLKYVRLAREGVRPSSRDVRNPVFVAIGNEHDGYPHAGHMDFVENRLDEETGTIRGRAILPNKNFDLAPGLFARLRLPGSPRYEAILIPDRAIGTDQAEKFVLVVGPDKKVQRKVVKLGPISHGLRVIREGLTGEELIILGGMQRARPNTEVAYTMETIEAGKEVLPDEYQPVPEDQWLIPKRKMAANVWRPLDDRPAAPDEGRPANAEAESPRATPGETGAGR